MSGFAFSSTILRECQGLLSAALCFGTARRGASGLELHPAAGHGQGGVSGKLLLSPIRCFDWTTKWYLLKLHFIVFAIDHYLFFYQRCYFWSSMCWSIWVKRFFMQLYFILPLTYRACRAGCRNSGMVGRMARRRQWGNSWDVVGKTARGGLGTPAFSAKRVFRAAR
jgi:hypothetical protein